jgi:hypothetical protein
MLTNISCSRLLPSHQSVPVGVNSRSSFGLAQQRVVSPWICIWSSKNILLPAWTNLLMHNRSAPHDEDVEPMRRRPAPKICPDSRSFRARSAPAWGSTSARSTPTPEKSSAFLQYIKFKNPEILNDWMLKLKILTRSTLLQTNLNKGFWRCWLIPIKSPAENCMTELKYKMQ